MDKSFTRHCRFVDGEESLETMTTLPRLNKLQRKRPEIAEPFTRLVDK